MIFDLLLYGTVGRLLSFALVSVYSTVLVVLDEYSIARHYIECFCLGPFWLFGGIFKRLIMFFRFDDFHCCL